MKYGLPSDEDCGPRTSGIPGIGSNNDSHDIFNGLSDDFPELLSQDDMLGIEGDLDLEGDILGGTEFEEDELGRDLGANAEAGSGEEEKEPEDLRANDTACALCDDGGEIMSCDGNCMRSFHIGLGDGEFSTEICNPLEMPHELSKRLLDSHELFECPNCVTNRHQCFLCKREGDSSPFAPLDDNLLRRCAIYTCGKFFHPRCLKVRLGEQLVTCPLHRCANPKCSVKSEEDPLIPCRRCPVAYHETCMPKDILKTCTLEHGKRLWIAKFDEDGNSIGDPVERSLIYCMKHTILPGEDNPGHSAPLFSPELLRRWKLHYAQKFPDLSWSVKIVAAEKERTERVKSAAKDKSREKAKLAAKSATSPKKLPSTKTDTPRRSKSGRDTGFDDLRSEGDATGAVKRRRIVKASEPTAADDAPQAPRLPEASQLEQQNGICLIPAEADLSGQSSLPQPLTLNGVPSITPASSIQESGPGRPSDNEEEEMEDHPDLFEFEQEAYWDKRNMKKRIEKAWEEDSAKHSLHDVWQKAFKPDPYQMPSKKSVTAARLRDLKVAFQMAEKDRAKAKDYVDQRTVKELMQHEDNLRITLAPYLFGTRYSSYGRHFTNSEHLHTVAKKLEVLAQPGDTIVDFSCGANEFVPLFKRYCLTKGKRLKGIAFDILTPVNITDFRKGSWFDVPVGTLGNPDQLIIGVNPPYGKNNSLAEKFLFHAARFRPRLILLIVPPSTRTPENYIVVLEDQKTMADKSFYIPGLEKEEGAQWNKITPAFRVLARRDMYPFGKGLHSRHLQGPGWEFNFAPMNEQKRLNQRMMAPIGVPIVHGYNHY